MAKIRKSGYLDTGFRGPCPSIVIEHASRVSNVMSEQRPIGMEFECGIQVVATKRGNARSLGLQMSRARG